MLSPSQVLDCHLDLSARVKTAEFRALLDYSFESDWHGRYMSEAELAENARHLTERTAKSVDMAHLYRVTPDMVDLLVHAAASLDDSDTYAPDLAPTSHGLVHFAKPVRLKELRGQTMLAHWMLWAPLQVQSPTVDTFTGKTKMVTRTTMMMVWWNDLRLEPDEVWRRTVAEVARASETPGLESKPVSKSEAERMLTGVLGRWAWLGMDFMEDGHSLGAMERAVPKDVLDHERELNGEDEVLATHTTNLTRIAHTLWLMLGQTVTTVADEPVDRPTVRRARRAKLPGRVTVIKLRREDASGKEYLGPVSVERHHHWIVRGFWRWQACGPGRTERRRIWVAAHFRGPLDKPLLHSEKLYSWDR